MLKILLFLFFSIFSFTQSSAGCLNEFVGDRQRIIKNYFIFVFSKPHKRGKMKRLVLFTLFWTVIASLSPLYGDRSVSDPEQKTNYMSPKSKAAPTGSNTGSEKMAAGMNSRLDVTTVGSLDLQRYLGKWYEIARFDHSFERGLTGVSAEYSLKENGMIEVRNSGFDAGKDKRRVALGKAKTTSVPGVLKVSFFLFFYSDYRILALGEDYDWALVGSGSPKYLWILSRTPSLPQEKLGLIVAEARRRGYETKNLIYLNN